MGILFDAPDPPRRRLARLSRGTTPEEMWLKRTAYARSKLCPIP
jgi:hypothetical protein